MKQYSIILITLISLWASPARSGEETKAEMPDQFNDIYIGMSLEDFVKVRPNARILDPFRDEKPDPKKPNQVLWERSSNHPVFTQFHYSFDDNRLRTVGLVAILLRSEVLNSKWEVFLSDAVTKWGKPDLISVIDADRGRHAPALFWKRGSLLISATFIADGAEPGPSSGGIELRIQAADNTPLGESFYKIVEVNEVEWEKIIAPVEATIERLIKEAPPTTQNSEVQR